MSVIALDHLSTLSDSPQAPDHLAGAVLYSLSRPMPDKGMWGLVRTVVLGVLSFGLWPLFEWVRRFGDLARGESVQWEHLVEWLRLRSGHPEAGALEDWIPRIERRSAFFWTPLLLGMLVIAMFMLSGQFSWMALLGSTYRFGKIPLQGMSAATARQLFTIWTIGLGAGYLIHWLNLVLHVRGTERLVERINRLAEHEGLERVPAPSAGWGLRPMWLAAGIGLAVCGAGWGLPMMLAGALQRRYVLVGGRRLRGVAAERLRSMLARRHPGMALPAPVMLRRRCENPICRAAVSMGANFCPRCGGRLWAPVDRVA